MRRRNSLFKTRFSILFCAALLALPALTTFQARAETANDVSLILAIDSGDDDLAIALLQHGASANAFEGAWPNRSALMLASWFGRPKIAVLLISRGADINATDQDGETPLMWALQDPLGALECTTLLLDHGVNVNAADKSGRTALMYAMGTQDVQVNLGSDNKTGKGGRIRVSADPKIVRLLLAKKADVNARDDTGETALMEAASDGRLDLVKLVLNAGAQKEAQDRAGHDAAWFAEQAGHKEIAQYLARAAG